MTIQPLSSYEDVRGIKPCAMTMCGDQCQLVASQAVWTNDVCTGALLDGGAAGIRPPRAPAASRCTAAAGAGATRGVESCGCAGAAPSAPPRVDARHSGRTAAIRSTVDGVRCKFGFLCTRFCKRRTRTKLGP
jgi:hypothetical protein